MLCYTDTFVILRLAVKCFWALLPEIVRLVFESSPDNSVMTDLLVSDGTTVLNFWNLLFGIAVRPLLIFLLVLMSFTIYMLNSISTS